MQLRATLPVTIFISPNQPLDEDGNLVRQAPVEAAASSTTRMTGIAPPGYGEHILDQLYEDVDLNGLHSGFQTPAIQSGVNTPFYALSRAGSAENLHQMAGMQAVPPAALSSRLQDVSMDPSSRNHSYNSLSAAATDGATTPHTPHAGDSSHNSPMQSAPLSRSHSGENPSGINTPEHVEFEDLNKVPSYSTAVKTPARPLSMVEGGLVLPDYNSAVSAPSSPTIQTAHLNSPLDSIPEISTNEVTAAPPPRPRPSRRQTSLGISSFFHHHSHHGLEDDVRRRLHLLQTRGQS